MARLGKKGIHVPISVDWSEAQRVEGNDVLYKLWNKKGKIYALKLTMLGEENYRLDLSETLENADFTIGEIFELREVPFDSQYTVFLSGKKGVSSLEFLSGGVLKGNKAINQLRELFKYDDVGRLLKDIFKSSNISFSLPS